MSQLEAASLWLAFNNISAYCAAITLTVWRALGFLFLLCAAVGAMMASLHLSAVR